MAAYVYILANKRGGILYTGVTSDLERRMYEHKQHLVDGFTKKYDVTKLVWFLAGEGIVGAIELEKKIKNRNRQWKIDLIEQSNPNWDDLSEKWIDSATTPKGSAQNDAQQNTY
jgi:putative endonuclease